jgi:PAS domain S-box-containing protein
MARLKDWLQAHAFRLKLIAVALTAELALVLGLLYVMVEHNERALKTQLERRVEQNALLFNAALAGELIAHDYSTLRETLQLMRNEGALAYAVLEDARGRRIVAAGWQDDQPLPAAAAEESRSPQDGGMLHVAVPIRYQRHDLGTLHYGIDTGFIDRTRSELLRRSALLAATGFLLSALLVLALGYRMMRRLGQVAAVTRRISEGQLAARVGEAERDEIGRLGQAVDSMARALEEKLREIHASEERLSFVIQSTTDGVWDWDVVRNQTYFSPRFRELLGYDDEAEFRLMFYFRTALHPDDRDRALNALENTLKRRGRFDETYRLRCKNGSYRWFRGRGQAQWDGQGVACRFAGSLTDISTQQAIEDALRESEETLYYSVRGSSDGIWDWDLLRDRYHLSPRFRELLGYEPEELSDSRASFLDNLHPDDRESVERAVREHFEKRAPYDLAYRLRRKDGSYRWFRGRGQAVWDEHGRAVRFSGAITDIEAQKRAEEYIQALLAEQQAILDNALIGIWMVRNRIVVSCNRRCEELFGYGVDELKGHSVRVIYPSDEAFEARGRRVYGILAGGGNCTEEMELVRKDGSRFWCATSGRAIDPADPHAGSIWVFTDVTEQHDTLMALRESEARFRKLNEELEQRVRERTAELSAANKELESFSYSVSHDLVAPLRAIDGYSRMIEEDYEPLIDARGRGYIQRIRVGTHRMQQLIDDMLALSRITRDEMRRVDVNLSALAEQVVSDLKQSQPQRAVSTHITLDIHVSGDPNLLRIVLENLLRNAWKFTARHAVANIAFGVLREGDKPVYFVRDDGAGFDMKYSSKLFGAFQRMHRAQDFEGTGIGLAIVHRIIQRHGGRIWAEAAPEQGATFFFTLS